MAQGNYEADIDAQDTNNYTYDLIGNLNTDALEAIESINWTVYGKIKKIEKGGDNQVTITYGYDAGGNRTYKNVYDFTEDANTKTFYIRDAQGNVLAVYTINDIESELKWAEQHLYGSSRLGMWRSDTTISDDPPVVIADPIYDSIMLGSRNYELTNHLGNVLSVISDKKIGNDSSGVVNYYIAEVLSQNDYYPFGMLMPGRQYTAGTGYRYGFNGKEKDNDIKGDGAQYDYGFRIYDPRLGRFLSVDPIATQYPELTPYQFASNMPIESIDLDGLEAISSKEAYINISLNYDSKLKKISKGTVWMQANSPNMPNWISNNILNYNASKRCENCYKSINTVTVGEFGATVDYSSLNIEGDLEAMADESRTLSGRSGTYVATSTRGGSRSDLAMEAGNPGKENPMALNATRLAKANAALTIITATANIFSRIVKNDQVANLMHQINTVPIVMSLVQEGIEGKIAGVSIPEKFLNSSSIESIANYVLSGKTIYTYTTNSQNNEVKTENAELMKIAKSITSELDFRRSKAKSAIQENFRQQYQKPAIDNTGHQ